MERQTRLRCQCKQAFFGLPPDYRKQVFRRIFEITYYSEGGINYAEAYAFPVWQRNFVYQQLKETKEKEKAETDKITNNPKSVAPTKPQIPSFAMSKNKSSNLSKYKDAVKNPRTK